MTGAKDIAKSIKTMLPDIKSEIIIADLIERGYPLQRILVKYEGLFKRNFTKDVTDVYLDVMNDVIVFHVSRDSLYDILPQNMFHESIQLGNVEAEERKKRFERIKKEEENARRFFLPFDNDLFYQKVECEIAYRSFLVDPGIFFQKLFMFDRIGMPDYSRKLVTYALYNDRFIGDIDLTAACLSDLLQVEVRVAKKYQTEYLPINENHGNNDHSTTMLGENLLCGDIIAEHGLVWEFTMVLGDQDNVLDYIDKEKGNLFKLINLFFEYFVPFEISVKTNVITKHSHFLTLTSQQDVGKEDLKQNEKSIYLGYNANI